MSDRPKDKPRKASGREGRKAARDEERDELESEDEDVTDEEDEDEDDVSASDDDEQDEDEDLSSSDEDEDDEEVVAARDAVPRSRKSSRSRPARSRRSPLPAAKRKPARRPMPDESIVDTPSRQTLGMMGAVALVTLAMWGSAKFACNAHPTQTRKPREVSLQELAKDPKDAALEMQQRWNSYDFAAALELAKGSIAEEIKKGLEGCKSDPGCESKKTALEGKALATAALLAREGDTATVRVDSRGGALGEKSVIYAVEREGTTWKVKGHTEAPPPPAPTPDTSAAPPASGQAPEEEAPGHEGHGH
jgi:hypothetical protein